MGKKKLKKIFNMKINYKNNKMRKRKKKSLLFTVIEIKTLKINWDNYKIFSNKIKKKFKTWIKKEKKSKLIKIVLKNPIKIPTPYNKMKLMKFIIYLISKKKILKLISILLVIVTFLTKKYLINMMKNFLKIKKASPQKFKPIWILERSLRSQYLKIMMISMKK